MYVVDSWSPEVYSQQPPWWWPREWRVGREVVSLIAGQVTRISLPPRPISLAIRDPVYLKCLGRWDLTPKFTILSYRCHFCFIEGEDLKVCSSSHCQMVNINTHKLWLNTVGHWTDILILCRISYFHLTRLGRWNRTPKSQFWAIDTISIF